MKPVIDMRSDTVTRPTAEMRRVIAGAEVGDDVFGDDPTVQALEMETATILGKEAALFVPSGTMANQIALSVHTRRGDEVICESESHIFLYEAGGAAVNSGVQLHPLPGRRGLFDLAALLGAVRPDDPHQPPTRLVCFENTHNRACGRVLPHDVMAVMCGEMRRRGIPLHLDGARLWNAAVASGIPEIEWCRDFDSIAVCFSKGLGAPVGSALAGSAAWIDQARRVRKRMGGGMRQAGLIAAGALHALRHNRGRLAEDHARAGRLAEGMAGLPGLRVRLEDVETNVVIAALEEGAAAPAEWCSALAEEGLLVVGFGARGFRLCTHLDVDDAGVDQALAILRKTAPLLCGERPGGARQPRLR